MAGSGLKVFVTGACGFVGSHLCEALRHAGHDVTGMAVSWYPSSNGWLDEVEGVKKVRGDIRNAEPTEALIKGHDIVFHLAAQIDVHKSYTYPYLFVDCNVVGTLNILDAARETGAKLIHTSSSEVYGTAQYEPQDEDHPIHPQSPYAASKVAADALVEAYRLSYGLKAVTLRPFNTYGPRQSERAVIARIMKQAHGPDEKIVLGNMETKRDFTYVSDTVAAFLAVMDLEDGVYNCGTGRKVSIGRIAELAHNGKAVISDPARYRPEASEVHVLRAETLKLQMATGWRPEVSLEDGLEKTAAWHRSR